MLAVLIGRAAMLESMNHWVPHAGNVLVARTLDHLAGRGYHFADLQMPTEHTMRLGARLIGRARLRAAPARRARRRRAPQLSDGSIGIVASST